MLRYLTQLSREQIANMLADVLLCADDELLDTETLITNNKVSFTMSFLTTLENLPVRTKLSRYYEVNDYHIEVFDYTPRDDVDIRYRKEMLSRFGNAYALTYLLNDAAFD